MSKLVVVAFFLMNCFIFSQEKIKDSPLENIPLLDLIPILEQKFEHRFSYIQKTVQNKSATLTINDQSTIEDILAQLTAQTLLNFEITGTKFITIRPGIVKKKTHICGFIFDEYQKPLKDARIFLKGSRINLVSDQNGYFESNDADANSVILISADGFRQRVFQANNLMNDPCEKIFLSYASVELLEEVMIHEYIAKGITKQSNNIALNIKKIELLPGLVEPDILQSIQLVPGVNNPFETASGIYVRGSSPHQNLILWNGIRTYNQGHMFGMLSAFNPYAADDVLFLKKGVDASYGNSVAGVIDISSSDEVTNDFQGSTGINQVHADAVIKIPLIKDYMSLQISGRRSYTDYFESYTYKKLADRVFQNTKITENEALNTTENDFYYTDTNTDLIIKPSKSHKIKINTLYSKNDLDFRAGNTIGNSYNDQLITENEGYRAYWSANLTQDINQNISGYFTKYLLQYQFVTKTNDLITESESKINSIQDIGLQYDFNFTLATQHQLSTGYQFTQHEIRYAFVTKTPSYELILDQDKNKLNQHVAFTEYKFNEKKSLLLKLGLRATYYEDLEAFNPEPRLYIQKHLTPDWNINASYEMRSQPISKIKESVVSDLDLENQVWTLANKDQFPIIDSQQLTLGSTFTKNKWTVDLDHYIKRIKNITTLTAGFLNPIDNTFNKGQSTIFGIDLFIKKQFKKYKTWISYSYINTRNKFERINDNEPFPGNWNIEHTIKWSQFYEINNLKLSLGWLWHTGKAFTNVTEANNIDNIVTLSFGEINESNLPVYHRLDFSLLYDFRLKPDSNTYYRLGASVLNIYDRINILNRSFRTTNSLDNQLINTEISSLRITPNLSLRVFW